MGSGVSSEHKQARLFWKRGQEAEAGKEIRHPLEEAHTQAINTHARMELSHLPKVTRRAGRRVTKASLPGFQLSDAGPGHRAAEWSS